MAVILETMEMPQGCDDCNLESYCGLWRASDGKSRHKDCPLKEMDNLKVKNVDKQQVLESVFRNCVRFDVKVEKGESIHGVTMNGKPVTDEDLEEILSSIRGTPLISGDYETR